MADSITKSQAINRLQAYKARLARVRESSREVARRGVGVALSGASAFGTGFVRGAYGTGEMKRLNIPGTGFPADLALGVTVAALGATGVLEDQSDNVTALGAGMLGAYAGIEGLAAGAQFAADGE